MEAEDLYASEKIEELMERLEAIVNWCDLVRANKDEFEGHGVSLLEGPIFDAAREALGTSQPTDAIMGVIG